MPSPIGHALAGATIVLISGRTGRAFAWTKPMGDPIAFRTRLIVCVLCAALPDADLLYHPIHRAFTDSVGSTILVTIMATGVTGWVTGRRSIGFGLLCGLAWGSHTVLDWLGADLNPPRGIKAFWPFSDQWFISGWDVFRGTERRRIFTLESLLYNIRAVLQELALLGPPMLLAFWLRARARSRVGGDA